jgi:hypothetical protein
MPTFGPIRQPAGQVVNLFELMRETGIVQEWP